MRRPNPETSYPNAKINARNTSHTVLGKTSQTPFQRLFLRIKRWVS